MNNKSFFGLDINSKQTPYILLAIVLGLWVSCWILGKLLLGDAEAQAQFGDLFGAVNALFSGLAFAGIIYSILIQSEELKAQREELALTRQELQETRKEFEQQNNTLKLQRFENTFYNLLAIHHQLIENVQSADRNVKGRQVFINLINEWFTDLNQQKMAEFDNGVVDKYRHSYRSYVRGQYYLISHYLQSLRTLYEFVKTSTLISEHEHEHYFGILKFSISFPERRFLFYHITLGDSPDGTSSSLRLLEKDLTLVGSIGKDYLLRPSHLDLLDHLNEASVL